MEVTEEMIKAVQEYQAAEAKRKHDEYQAECSRKLARIENRAKEGVRAVIPGLTDDQFDDLTAVFDTYFEEMWDR